MGIVGGYQRWERTLFLHWPVPAPALRRLVDPRLSLDLFDGTAWVGITPFTVRRARLRGGPPLPVLSTYQELNVRTYVRHAGEPGVWFLRMEASRSLAAWAARLAFGLPFQRAQMDRRTDGEATSLMSETDETRFFASWTPGAPLGASWAGSLEHFLVERYALFVRHGGPLIRISVRHRPWQLHAAALKRLESRYARALGLPRFDGAPLAHCSPGVDAAIELPTLSEPAPLRNETVAFGDNSR